MAEAARQFRLSLAPWQQVRKQWWLIRRACFAAYRDNCFGIAKGVAYSALLSFFPVLTCLTAILVQANAYAVSRSLSNLIFRVVPPGTEEIVRYNFIERGQQPVWLLVVAVLLSLWAASGVTMSLMEGFRAAYRIPKGRPMLPQRGVAVLLVFCAAVPVLAASALIVFGTRTEQWLLTKVGVVLPGEQVRGWVALVSNVLRSLIAILAIVLGTSLLYYLGPNYDRRRSFQRLWPGAVLATLLWWVSTLGFAWYVRNIANYNVLYGSVGAVIALIVWMYLLSVIVLIGCEYNAETERMSA